MIGKDFFDTGVSGINSIYAYIVTSQERSFGIGHSTKDSHIYGFVFSISNNQSTYFHPRTTFPTYVGVESMVCAPVGGHRTNCIKRMRIL
jgi:hypothetical protein